MQRPHSVPDPIIDVYPERANLYPITLQPVPTTLYLVRREERGRVREDIRFVRVADAEPVNGESHYIRWGIRGRVLATLRKNGFQINEERFSDIVLDTTKNHARQKRLRIYPAYEFRILDIGGRFFLCIDHHLKTQLLLSLDALRARNDSFLPYSSQRVFCRRSPGEEWIEGAFVAATPGGSEIMLPDGESVEALPNDVIPYLSREQVLQMAPALGVSAHDLERTIKQLSFLTCADAPRARLDACTEFVLRLSQEAFPIRDGSTTIRLDPIPAKIRPPVFSVARDLTEPLIAFDRVDQSRRAKDITKGLTSFGVFEKPLRPLRLAVITTADRKANMDRLIQQLNRGSFRYRGAKLTFGSEFAVLDTIVVGGIEEYKEGIAISSRPRRGKRPTLRSSICQRLATFTIKAIPIFRLRPSSSARESPRRWSTRRQC